MNDPADDGEREHKVPPPLRRAENVAYRSGNSSTGTRAVPEETAIALTYDGSTQAVMMATPADLEDFALGFSLTEGIVGATSEISSLEILSEEAGIELRMWLAKPRGDALAARRRHFAGPTGCGLCGIDSLAEAIRPPAKVKGDLRLRAQEIAGALKSLAAAQPLNRETRAVHAAGLWQQGRGLLLAREDVGRHNALDKLVGAAARAGTSTADCVLLLTSRVSVEMVQKAAVLGTPILVAVSAPTALAIRMAEDAGITLVAIARDDGFEVFSHAWRVAPSATAASTTACGTAGAAGSPG
jgi:FdhD protein